MTNFYEAHRMWSNWRERAGDMRYDSLAALHADLVAEREQSVESRVRINNLHFEYRPEAHDVAMVSGASGNTHLAIPTHWAMSQLCNDNLKVPLDLIRRQGASGAEEDLQLVAANLNWGTRNAPREEMKMLWCNHNDVGMARCFTSMIYARLWDCDVVSWLREMTQDETNGWGAPMLSRRNREAAARGEALEKDIYRSDRNIFVFLVNEQNPLTDDEGKPLYRGFFCWNSVVKQMSLGFKAFLYQAVCDNHIIWGAEELFSLRMFHLGEHMTSRAQRELGNVIRGYVNAGTSTEQSVLSKAMQYQIAPTREETVEWLAKKKAGLPQFNLAESEAVVKATEERGKDPTNLWQIVNTGTRLSQEKNHADERNMTDRKFGALLEVVF